MFAPDCPRCRHAQPKVPGTHVHDLPPQIGSCQSVPDAAADAATIDGGSWTLNGISDMAELHPPDALGLDPQAARREAAERLLANHVAVARFAARGLGRAGKPPVSAPLSDPRASFDEAVLPLVDSSLRHVVDALLAGECSRGERGGWLMAVCRLQWPWLPALDCHRLTRVTARSSALTFCTQAPRRPLSDSFRRASSRAPRLPRSDTCATASVCLVT